MPEKYAVNINPLVDALVLELRCGTGSGALARSLTRRLEAFGPQVTVISKGNGPAVLLHWGCGGHRAQEGCIGAVEVRA